MLDSRYPNLASIDDFLPSALKRAVEEVCRRCELEAAFDRKDGAVFFHLPGRRDIGVWREVARTNEGWLRWDSARIDLLCRTTNARKMPEKEKLAAMEAAKRAEEHDREEKHQANMIEVEREAQKVLDFRTRHGIRGKPNNQIGRSASTVGGLKGGVE